MISYYLKYKRIIKKLFFIKWVIFSELQFRPLSIQCIYSQSKHICYNINHSIALYWNLIPQHGNLIQQQWNLIHQHTISQIIISHIIPQHTIAQYMSDSKTLIIRQYLSRCFFSVDTTKMIHRMKYIYFKRNFTLILIRRVSILFFYISRDCNPLTFGTVICFVNVTIFKILCIINYVYMN